MAFDEKEHPALTPEANSATQTGNGERLPILDYTKEIKEAFLKNPSLLIVGETGSGKTTQTPLLLREVLPENDKMLITQPRRVAVRSVSRYVAERAGCDLGEEVGYQVRFDDQTTEGTRINFITDGILLRKIQMDPLLSDYSVVMVDEAHERSLNIDFALGLLKQIQRERQEANLKPLKIIVASATLEKEKFAKYFDNSGTVEIPGRLHPVEIHYQKENPNYCLSAAQLASAIATNKEKPGDILIFMPGKEEIDNTMAVLNQERIPGTVILPLYGQMSPEEQDRIFAKFPGRKIIVATNIAETSITVPGVRHIIDSGYIKQIEFNPRSGIEALAAIKHSKSGCVQRAGRAGRTAPGECWRLYNQESFDDRPEFQKPELLRSNLAHVVLMMKSIGVKDARSFDFIDKPDTEVIERAIGTLKSLGALDDKEELTILGEMMAELPLEPHLSRMLIEADKFGCLEPVCSIASFIGGRSVFLRPEDKQWEADSAHREFKNPNSDFLTLLNVWRAYEINDYSSGWARDKFLNPRVLAEARNVRCQLLKILRQNEMIISDSDDPESISKSVAAGLIDNLLHYWGRHAYKRIGDKEGHTFYIHPASTAFSSGHQWAVAGELVSTTKNYARLVQGVKPEWVKEVRPDLVEEIPGEKLYYSGAKDAVVQQVANKLKMGGVPLFEEEREVRGPEASRVFAQEMASWRRGVQPEYDFVNYNQRIISELQRLWLKTAGKLLEQ